MSHTPKGVRQIRHLDADGDLTVRTDSIDFTVCSSALRRAPPVWQAMLFGPGREAKPRRGDWIITMEEDDPRYLELAFRMAHGLLADIPRRLSATALAGLLVILDKYGLLHLTVPWAFGWLVGIRKPSSPAEPNWRILKIHIAWELGAEDVLRPAIRDLIFNLAMENPPNQGPTFRCGQELVSFQQELGPSDLQGMGRIGLHQYRRGADITFQNSFFAVEPL